ncbi:protein ROS1-like [Coffea eugenioides]|uniref:protein ROS1-like n=1 Tax=Coffea eugenioides TaxID=49369 RepID=UPI000F60527F|nr:protein ROS1-like [Coffea eugenioides]
MLTKTSVIRVSGTILVFADDESSNYPISVPGDWLWHLEKRFVYCRKSSIFKGMQQWEIESCFSRGFVCARAFDIKTRESKPLAAWLHPPGGKEEDAKEKDDQ